MMGNAVVYCCAKLSEELLEDRGYYLTAAVSVRSFHMMIETSFIFNGDMP